MAPIKFSSQKLAYAISFLVYFHIEGIEERLSEIQNIISGSLFSIPLCKLGKLFPFRSYFRFSSMLHCFPIQITISTQGLKSPFPVRASGSDSIHLLHRKLFSFDASVQAPAVPTNGYLALFLALTILRALINSTT